MQREIKFKGQEIGTKEWVCGYLIPNETKEKWYIVEYAETDSSYGEETDLYVAGWHEVIPETIEQIGKKRDYGDFKKSLTILECVKTANSNMIAAVDDKKLFEKVIDDAIESIKSRMPEKPNNVETQYIPELMKDCLYGECPSCGSIVSSLGKFCIDCGKALDWED